jgi:hypothetical protein
MQKSPYSEGEVVRVVKKFATFIGPSISLPFSKKSLSRDPTPSQMQDNYKLNNKNKLYLTGESTVSIIPQICYL